MGRAVTLILRCELKFPKVKSLLLTHSACTWVLIAKACHSKIGHFGSHITDQQYIVAGEISVDDAIGVEK